MVWSIDFTPRAAKSFRKLDKPIQKEIRNFLREVSELEDPRARGKALTGSMSRLWRWRVRDYRILASIRDRKVLIAIVGIGHRSTVYDL